MQVYKITYINEHEKPRQRVEAFIFALSDRLALKKFMLEFHKDNINDFNTEEQNHATVPYYKGLDSDILSHDETIITIQHRELTADFIVMACNNFYNLINTLIIQRNKFEQQAIACSSSDDLHDLEIEYLEEAMELDNIIKDTLYGKVEMINTNMV